MAIEGTVGGSELGPTVDAEGVPIEAGDTVTVVHMDEPLLQYLVGQQAVVEWVQDVFPFSQVFIVIGTEGQPGWTPISTFSAWVKKVS